jgi:hypothetical protein
MKKENILKKLEDNTINIRKLIKSNLLILFSYVIATKLFSLGFSNITDSYFTASKLLFLIIPVHLSILIGHAVTYITSIDEQKKILGKKYAIVAILVLFLGIPSCIATTFIKIQ